MRRSFNPGTSLLAGRPIALLKADLETAQNAYLELTSGTKVVNASYAQGAGSRAVTYTAANISDLTILIRQLQLQLGIIPHARKPIWPVF